MTINVRVRDGMCPDPTTGDGGATEGDIRGSFSDIIDVVGVKDLAGGHCLVTENSPQGLSVLIADGIVYIPNADYDELDSNEPKFYEAILKDIPALEIAENTSGSTRIDLACVKVDKTITPDEHASNISTAIIVQGTPGAGTPATPDNYLKLAEVEVANGAATIVNVDITDSRVQSTINQDYLETPVNEIIKNGITLDEITEPDTPAANKVIVYAKDVGGVSKLFFKQDDGTEVEIGTGGGGSTDGWNDASETWEYVSVDDPTGIFRVNADVTGKYSAGMRIKFTNGGNTIYGIITAVGSYTGGYTSITFLHEIDPNDSLALYLLANSAITANYYSTQKAPFGFPLNELKWSVTLTDSTNYITTPTNDTWWNPGSLSIIKPIGLFYGMYQVSSRASANLSAGQYIATYSSLSTANNSSTLTQFDCYSGSDVGATSASWALPYNFYQRKMISSETKTTLYLIHKAATSGILTANCGHTGSWGVPTYIQLTCAYL